MNFSKFLEFISPRLATFFIAMTPIGELRASIPVALSTYSMNIVETYIISVLGNMVPVVAILWILEPVSRFLMNRFKILIDFTGSLIIQDSAKKFELYEGFALITL